MKVILSFSVIRFLRQATSRFQIKVIIIIIIIIILIIIIIIIIIIIK